MFEVNSIVDQKLNGTERYFLMYVALGQLQFAARQRVGLHPIYIPTVDKIKNPTEIPINELWLSGLSFYGVRIYFRTFRLYRKKLETCGHLTEFDPNDDILAA